MRPMDGCDALHCLELDDEAVVNEKIEACFRPPVLPCISRRWVLGAQTECRAAPVLRTQPTPLSGGSWGHIFVMRFDVKRITFEAMEMDGAWAPINSAR